MGLANAPLHTTEPTSSENSSALFVEVAWWDAGMLGRSPGQRPVWLKQASAAQASGPFSCMAVMESRMAD